MPQALSQKEYVDLQDALNQEYLCIQKYAGYANRAQDAQLKQLFMQHRSQEQQHANTLQQIISGQIPGSSGQGQQGQSQQQGQTQGQAQMQSQQFTAQGQTNTEFDSDLQLCADLLMTENWVSGEYDDIVFSTTNAALRQAIQHIQQEEQQHGADLIDYMAQHGQFPG